MEEVINNPGCYAAAENFINGWDYELANVYHYQGGVYSPTCSGSSRESCNTPYEQGIHISVRTTQASEPRLVNQALLHWIFATVHRLKMQMEA
jgi:hypothetical protein